MRPGFSASKAGTRDGARGRPTCARRGVGEPRALAAVEQHVPLVPQPRPGAVLECVRRSRRLRRGGGPWRRPAGAKRRGSRSACCRCLQPGAIGARAWSGSRSQTGRSTLAPRKRSGPAADGQTASSRESRLRSPPAPPRASPMPFLSRKLATGRRYNHRAQARRRAPVRPHPNPRGRCGSLLPRRSGQGLPDGRRMLEPVPGAGRGDDHARKSGVRLDHEAAVGRHRVEAGDGLHALARQPGKYGATFSSTWPGSPPADFAPRGIGRRRSSCVPWRSSRPRRPGRRSRGSRSWAGRGPRVPMNTGNRPAGMPSRRILAESRKAPAA